MPLLGFGFLKKKSSISNPPSTAEARIKAIRNFKNAQKKYFSHYCSGENLKLNDKYCNMAQHQYERCLDELYRLNVIPIPQDHPRNTASTSDHNIEYRSPYGTDELSSGGKKKRPTKNRRPTKRKRHTKKIKHIKKIKHTKRRRR